MTTRGAFILGAILAVAVCLSVFRRRQYPSFGAWWNGEGVVIWIVTGAIFAVIYFD